MSREQIHLLASKILHLEKYAGCLRKEAMSARIRLRDEQRANANLKAQIATLERQMANANRAKKPPLVVAVGKAGGI